MDQRGPTEWQARTLWSWHVAILRFALTHDNADRLGVLAIANEIDRLRGSHDERVDFDFFRRTSAELCEAILQPNGAAAKTLLQQYLARIDDSKLKCALTVVLNVEQPEQASAKRRSKAYSAPWRTRGFRSRHGA
jgi:hypothetical protein